MRQRREVLQPTEPAVTSQCCSLHAAAHRELREECPLAELPEVTSPEFRIRLFNAKKTKAIRGRSYTMHNFIALESDNKWLQRQLLIQSINPIDKHLDDSPDLVPYANSVLARREKAWEGLLQDSGWPLCDGHS